MDRDVAMYRIVDAGVISTSDRREDGRVSANKGWFWPSLSEDEGGEGIRYAEDEVKQRFKG
jgi:hypothetical protein